VARLDALPKLEQHDVGWAKVRGADHPRGQNRARHGPSKTGVNALVAQRGDYATGDFDHPTAQSGYETFALEIRCLMRMQ